MRQTSGMSRLLKTKNECHESEVRLLWRTSDADTRPFAGCTASLQMDQPGSEARIKTRVWRTAVRSLRASDPHAMVIIPQRSRFTRDRLRDGVNWRSRCQTSICQRRSNRRVPPCCRRITCRSGSAIPPPGEDWPPADDLSNPDLSMAHAFVREAGGYLRRSNLAAGGLSLRLFLPRYIPPALPTTMSRRKPGRRTTFWWSKTTPQCAPPARAAARPERPSAAADAMEAFRLIADHGAIDPLFTDLGLPRRRQRVRPGRCRW